MKKNFFNYIASSPSRQNVQKARRFFVIALATIALGPLLLFRSASAEDIIGDNPTTNNQDDTFQTPPQDTDTAEKQAPDQPTDSPVIDQPEKDIPPPARNGLTKQEELDLTGGLKIRDLQALENQKATGNSLSPEPNQKQMENRQDDGSSAISQNGAPQAEIAAEPERSKTPITTKSKASSIFSPLTGVLSPTKVSAAIYGQSQLDPRIAKTLSLLATVLIFSGILMMSKKPPSSTGTS